MRPSLLLVSCAIAFNLGCGSSMQLSHDEYERLPREYRQEIFDAENDLVIAKNRQDDANDKKDSARKALSELEAKWSRTNERLQAQGQAAKIPKARKVFDMKAAYATSLIDVASAGIERAEVETRLNRARLALSRQRQLARIGRATVASLKPFEEAVASLEGKLKSAVAAESDSRARVQTQLTGWKTALDEYSSSTGDYDTGVWGE